MDTSDFSFTLDQRPTMMKLEEVLVGDSPMVRGQEQSKTFRNRAANINIRRSLQLLDESVAFPAAATRRTPHRGGALQHSSYTPISSGSKYDVSGLLGPTPRKASAADQSYNQMDSTMFTNKSYLEDMTEEVTTTNVGLLLEEDPGISACKGLFEDFQKCMKANVSESQSFDLIKEYENACREHVVLLRKLMKRATRNEPRFQKTFEMLDLIEHEQNTWQLVHSLLKDQLEVELRMDLPDEEMNEDGGSLFRKSDKKIVSDFFENNSEIRQSQLIVDWLESCALEKVQRIRDNIKFFSDRAVGWENTLHKLQTRESENLFGGTDRPLVDKIDPDAAVRQNKMVDDLDKEDESRLLQTLFVYIRAGQLQEAQDICCEHGQAWRAATLEGWKLYHDPNFEAMVKGQTCSVEGNPNRDIWRNVCWNMAKEPSYDQFEKAIYGVLSGNLQAVLPVCRDWLDYLWAHYKVLVDVRMEQELRTQKLSGRQLVSMPSEFWDQSSDAESVFRRLEAYENISKEGLRWYHVIQKWIILGDTEKLIEVMAGWVRDEQLKIPQHLLRFMAHLVLFLRTTQRHVRNDLCSLILEAYVEDLIQGNHKELVAHYVASLPSDAQVVWYARFLEGVEEKEERQACLDLATNAQLDIPQITKLVVENIRSHSTVDFNKNIDQEIDTTITQEDRKKIDAIDWLVFEQSQRSEAMRQANAVMRSFVAVKKLHAAKEVFNKLPSDSIDVIVKTWQYQTGSTDLPPEEANSVREYLCHRAYLNAMDSFNDLFNQYHHTKPTKPTLAEAASFTEKVAHEQQMKRYHQEMERWRHHLDIQTKTTKGMIYNVLLFADGGWMVDQKKVVSPDTNREHQMGLLRQLVLPGLCFLLHKILHTSGHYDECLKIADLVASEQHGLHKVFRKDELQQLLRLLRDSSLCNLNKNLDPLGYQSQLDQQTVNI
ncbi:nuclear pore complex protein Nup107-like [Ylistrum balloti]|uniref:nuclear pore complex protein Nup107-like n=1 Tax=Ylistrum balloti TaxID=509963 RepID=UPI002905DC31|nr:nuclear pore complex protein Nup107-like [Ylistrum balloti]XP_060066693.1 nuclear pore complex protein Nup107-like [Ylistrum balloti]XP_060066694.1 nuclear pore complex protein Nup107-like [Ylistrum balloti]XP_060066695.1 nuclear pore complex protein Nup107-like [Ylistrum balloti]